MVADIALPLPSLPEGWAADKDFKIINSLSKSVSRSIEPVGPHFLAYARRKKHKRTFSEDDRIQAANTVTKVEEEEDTEISEPEDPEMLLRDAKDWKNQDHYAVLGLSKYRFLATNDQIKRAHRKKVLKHHPDKKAAAGIADDDTFFKCIQKANEVLTDPIRRRQFDSVDEGADVAPPTKKDIQAGGDYYDLWSKFFEAEGRFSEVLPIPKFGGEDSSRDEVEGFYNFFYKFSSWRSFEYQDEDVPDDTENRDQKRRTEKKNTNARRKKKTEDTARLRKMVDEALANDERIKKFKKAGKQKSKKQIEKEEELARAQAVKDAEELKKREAEAAAALADSEAATTREATKKAKEAAKTAAKKNKRAIRNALTEVSHFGANATDVTPDVDLIVASANPEQIAELAAAISASKGDVAATKAAYAASAASLISAGALKKEHFSYF